MHHPAVIAPTSFIPCRAFGGLLLSHFDQYGYSFVRRSESLNAAGSFVSNAAVLHHARELITENAEMYYSKQQQQQHLFGGINEEEESFPMRSLRGPYPFRENQDDIRCWSIGRPGMTLGELRGEYYKQQNCSEEMLSRICKKRNVWPANTEHHQKVLERYYDDAQDLSLCIAGSLELALRSAHQVEEPLLLPRLMSKRDSHLEPKLYEKCRKTVEKAVDSAAAPRKSKVLRRTGGLGEMKERGEMTTIASESIACTDQQPQQQSTVLTRMSEHVDLSMVTLLMQDAQGGLEVRNRDGLFSPCPASSGTGDGEENVLLVHAGQFLETFSSGRIIATPHRVRTIDDAPDRTSVVFFSFCDFDAKLNGVLCGDLHPSLV